MNKTIFLILGMSMTIVLAGCTAKTPDSVQVQSGVQLTGAQSMTGLSGTQEQPLREELTGSFVSGALEMSDDKTQTPTSSGVPTSSAIPTGTKVSDPTPAKTVTTLIQERAKKPIDPNKLTEDDIDLMEQVIQKIQQIK